ncbi:MAG: DUF4214 domain-containing protein [Fulvimarina manganoxydans]|uniref:DUF4214 domain-containing protein n=1 Tax=Fulvimarina manganoxydans TaxID=937218 RepID=UPI00235406C5|nr:DUF4214 domain-containing protein [Fulvimarina manganoxydans]MCK5933763.1 DUF4214 domain-containing protein [Fulvimarina manganoxydans]
MAHEISMAELGTLSNTYNAIKNAEFFYKVDFTAMNNSEVSGGAFLALDTDTNTLTVLTAATGVEANVPHPQHLHGFLPGEDGSVQNSMVPGISTDTDRDGIVELGEGIPSYGGILLSLTSPAGGAIADFPAPSISYFTFAQSYDLDELMIDTNSDDVADTSLSSIVTAMNLTQREIVLHGQTLLEGQGMGTDGEADGTAGYKAVLPIASGEVTATMPEDVMTGIEAGRISIGDNVIAFDIEGNAGQAYRLYEAALDRAPDLDGLSNSVEALDEGASLSSIAQNFIDSSEFSMRFGSDLTDQAFVSQLYMNVLDREGDTSGVDYWTNALDNGVSRADVLVGFSESSENQTAVMGQIEGGILLNDSVLV